MLTLSGNEVVRHLSNYRKNLVCDVVSQGRYREVPILIAASVILSLRESSLYVFSYRAPCSTWMTDLSSPRTEPVLKLGKLEAYEWFYS